MLNWGRYNGSPSEFDAVATELLDFVRLDVRNRITRRFPLTIALPAAPAAGQIESQADPHGAAGIPLRKVSLRRHEPVPVAGKPATAHPGHQFERRVPLLLHPERAADDASSAGRTRFSIDRVHIGLATVPMAVTASSAFPSFFPPLEFTSADVGASVGEFGRQAYTDGGVFDNLGVRMFRFLDELLPADHGGLDGVLVSDVGKRIKVLPNRRRAERSAPPWAPATS